MEVKQAAGNKEEPFLRAFAEARDTSIHPAMEAMAEQTYFSGRLKSWGLCIGRQPSTIYDFYPVVRIPRFLVTVTFETEPDSMVIVCLSHAAGIRIVDSENAVTSDASSHHGRLDAFVSEFHWEWKGSEHIQTSTERSACNFMSGGASSGSRVALIQDYKFGKHFPHC